MKKSINVSNIVPKAGRGGLTILRFSVTLLLDGEPWVTVDGHLYYNDRTVHPPKLVRGPQLVFWRDEVLTKAKAWLDANPRVQDIMGEKVENAEEIGEEGEVEL